jgi:hypothetical protein
MTRRDTEAPSAEAPSGEAPSGEAPAGPAATPAAGNVDALSRAFALFTSPERLKGVGAGAAAITGDRSDADTPPAPPDVSPALLNPRDSLPRPLSVEEMRKQVEPASASRPPQAY